MPSLTLAQANKIVEAALAKAREMKIKPLAVAVLDARGALKAFAAADGTALRRGEIAIGKANGALGLGVGSRTLGTMAVERPHFIAAATQAIGPLVPVPGGVLIAGVDGPLGAVGISGDTSDNDEAAVLAGIAASGLTAQPG